MHWCGTDHSQLNLSSHGMTWPLAHPPPPFPHTQKKTRALEQMVKSLAGTSFRTSTYVAGSGASAPPTSTSHELRDGAAAKPGGKVKALSKAEQLKADNSARLREKALAPELLMWEATHKSAVKNTVSRGGTVECTARAQFPQFDLQTCA